MATASTSLQVNPLSTESTYLRRLVPLGPTTSIAIASLRVCLEIKLAIEEVKELGNIRNLLIIFFCVGHDRVTSACKSIERIACIGLNPVVRSAAAAEKQRVSVQMREASDTSVVAMSIERDMLFSKVFGNPRLTNSRWKLHVIKV